jgi:hypothetical protein
MPAQLLHVTRAQGLADYVIESWLAERPDVAMYSYRQWLIKQRLIRP